jgi:hypothetical protein
MAANPFGAHRVGVHKPTAWLGDMRPSHDVVGRAGSGIDYNCPTGAPFTLNVADQVATDRTPSLNRLTP